MDIEMYIYIALYKLALSNQNRRWAEFYDVVASLDDGDMYFLGSEELNGKFRNMH